MNTKDPQINTYLSSIFGDLNNVQNNLQQFLLTSSNTIGGNGNVVVGNGNNIAGN